VLIAVVTASTSPPTATKKEKTTAERIQSKLTKFDKPAQRRDTRSDLADITNLASGLDRLKCTAANPCLIPAPNTQAAFDLLACAIARLLDSFGAQVTKYDIAKKLRLDSQQVFPVALEITSHAKASFEDFTNHKPLFDGMFTRLREMTVCDGQQPLNGPCAATQLPIRPFIVNEVPDIRAEGIARMIENYPWIVEFVRIRGALLSATRKPPRALDAYPGFLKWRNAENAKPLVEETPVVSGTSVGHLVEDTKHVVSHLLDGAALQYLAKIGRLSRAHTLTGFTGLGENKDAWVRRQLTLINSGSTDGVFKTREQLAEWMGREDGGGYTVSNPLVLDHDYVMSHWDKGLLGYGALNLVKFNGLIKLPPSTFYPLVCKMLMIGRLAPYIQPVSATHPPLIIDKVVAEDVMTGLLFLCSVPILHPYVVFTESAKASLEKFLQEAVNGANASPELKEAVEKVETVEKMEAWFGSEAYAKTFQEFVAVKTVEN